MMAARWQELHGDLAFCVMPIPNKSKRPIGDWKAYQSARPSDAQVAEWAKSAANVGVVTGRVSNLIVLDLDSEDAIREAERRGLPDTLAVKTSKGRHVYFRHPGGDVRNRAGFLPGMDLRGDGGFVVGPGSVHPDGGEYSWINPPGLFELAAPPAWLMEALEKPESLTPSSSKERRSEWAETALRDEIARVLAAPEGQRNDALNRAAFSIGQIVAGGSLDGGTVVARLNGAALSAGLEAGEAAATIQSGMGSGMQQPREAPQRATSPTQPRREDAPSRPLPILNPADWQGKDAPPREWMLRDWIPLLQATYLTGPGSAGKSLFGQQLATCIALGRDFLGQEVRQAPAFYITCEDDADELHRRQKAICDAEHVRLADTDGKLFLVSLAGETDNALATFDKDGRLCIEPRFRQIEEAILEHPGALVVLDNVAHMTADEITRSAVAGFVNLLNRLAIRSGGAVLFLGHPNKSGDGYSGSTAWENQVRSRLYIETPADENGTVLDRDRRVLTRAKSNYAKNGETLEFRWHQWAFVRESDLPAQYRKQIVEGVAAGAENEAFMRCLAAATERKQAVSHNKGTNYAPTIFAGMIEGKKFTKKQFEAAMHRLRDLGKISLDQPLWRGPNRVMKQGIKAAENCTDQVHEPLPEPPASTPSQVFENTCTDLHASTPLGTTYHNGRGPEAAAPDGKVERHIGKPRF